MLYAYIIKMNNFLSDSFIIENDDNPWNNKDTEDFMRHLKAELFTIVYPASFIFMECMIGFNYSYDTSAVTSGTNYGPHSGMVKTFYAICLIPRVYNLLSLLLMAYLNINWGNDYFKLQRLVLMFLNIVVFIVLIILYTGNQGENGWKEQNVLARIWAPMELTTKIVEVVVHFHVRYIIDYVMPPEINSNKIEFVEDPAESGVPSSHAKIGPENEAAATPAIS